MKKEKMKGRLLSLGLAAVLAVAPAAFGMEMEKEAGGTGSNIHFHGYGELHYNDPKGSSLPNDFSQMDFHRMVWGISWDFSDQITLHTEVDFEHAAKEMELEYAYLDFRINPAFNLRAGSMLMPVGPLNETHEPPLFYSVERPYVQTNIIPTTWQEGGVGLFGSAAGLKYRLYLVSSLNAANFKADSGIRSGRGKVGGIKGSESPSDDIALVGRAEYAAAAGLDLGVSVYNGGANPTSNPSLKGVKVGIYEGDVRFRKGGLDLQAMYVTVGVDEAGKITGKIIGEKMVGAMLEAAYWVTEKWVPFVRKEQFNTQETVATGKTADSANDRDVLTYGIAFYPHRDVAIKIDREGWENGKGETGDRTNLGVAYMF